MAQRPPEWFRNEPFYEQRLNSLEINCDDILRAMMFLGFSSALQRMTVASASAYELEQILLHEQLLRDAINAPVATTQKGMNYE